MSMQLTRRLMLAAALAFSTGSVQAAPDSPSEQVARDLIETLGRRTIDALDQVGSNSTARRQAISAILDQTVDLTLIARLCLGRHWRSADEAQRVDYVALFREIVLATLARRMGYYTGAERFVVTATRSAGDDTMVASEIVYASKDPPLRLEWRVRRNGANATIIDVLPEGVSMVLTYRSEFNSVVSQHGVSGLLAELKIRAAAAAAA